LALTRAASASLSVAANLAAIVAIVRGDCCGFCDPSFCGLGSRDEASRFRSFMLGVEWTCGLLSRRVVGRVKVGLAGERDLERGADDGTEDDVDDVWRMSIEELCDAGLTEGEASTAFIAFCSGRGADFVVISRRSRVFSSTIVVKFSFCGPLGYEDTGLVILPCASRSGESCGGVGTGEDCNDSRELSS